MRETGCPGRGWSHHSCRYLKAVWMWNLMTRASGGLDITGDTGGLNPKSLSHPKEVHDSLISSDHTAISQAICSSS